MDFFWHARCGSLVLGEDSLIFSNEWFISFGDVGHFLRMCKAVNFEKRVLRGIFFGGSKVCTTTVTCMHRDKITTLKREVFTRLDFTLLPTSTAD